LPYCAVVVGAEHGEAHADDHSRSPDNGHEQTVSVAEAARLLSRDRTRVYALLRSGDLVAAPSPEDDEAGPVRIVRASLERWLVAGGARGGPLSPRNAWALIGLASSDQPFSERCLGLLERAEEISRTRARPAREHVVDLAPRPRRRATLVVRQLPRRLRRALEHDAALVRTGASVAAAYGWDELAGRPDPNWLLDAYLPLEAFRHCRRSSISSTSMDRSARRAARLTPCCFE
jgi:hypothetical protein